MVNSTPWMTRREAAHYARVSPQTIDAWRKAGLPSIKKGRRVLIDRRALDAFLGGMTPEDAARLFDLPVELLRDGRPATLVA